MMAMLMMVFINAYELAGDFSRLYERFLRLEHHTLQRTADQEITVAVNTLTYLSFKHVEKHFL